MDLAAANTGDNSLSIFYNPGDGILDEAQIIPLEDSPRSFYLADLDGDGLFDLVVTNTDGNTITVLKNTSTK